MLTPPPTIFSTLRMHECTCTPHTRTHIPYTYTPHTHTHPTQYTHTPHTPHTYTSHTYTHRPPTHTPQTVFPNTHAHDHTSHCCRAEKRYAKYLMDTLSMLLTMCSLEDQTVRLAANETLNKLVKATYLTYITRIQMTAFNEMKKVCVYANMASMCLQCTELQRHRHTKCVCTHTHTCAYVQSFKRLNSCIALCTVMVVSDVLCQTAFVVVLTAHQLSHSILRLLHLYVMALLQSHAM